MVRTHSERGSEVLEAAIVLPMLIVLAFCLIQVCLIAYEGTAMSAAIESAAMKPPPRPSPRANARGPGASRRNRP